MFIVPITKMEPAVSLDKLQKQEETQNRPKKDFGSLLNEALQEADNALQKAEEVDRSLVLGEADDLHTALIQAEQAAAAVEFTTQLTSKAVSAYNQIMGMQV